MLQEFTKSLKSSMYDRLSSPLFGSFVIAWLVWNYRLVLILLSSWEADRKFDFIDYNLYGVSSSNYEKYALLCLHHFIGPAIAAILFILLYPYPATWVFEYARNQQKKLRSIRQRIENETLLTAKEAADLRKSFEGTRGDYLREINLKDQDISYLRNMLQESENNLAKYLTETKNLKTELAQLNPAPTDAIEIEKFLLKNSFDLYDVKRNHLKLFEFLQGGKIFEGKSPLEHSWQISDLRLEILSENGHVFNRFDYFPQKSIFVSTDEEDILAARGQHMSVRNSNY